MAIDTIGPYPVQPIRDFLSGFTPVQTSIPWMPIAPRLLTISSTGLLRPRNRRLVPIAYMAR